MAAPEWPHGDPVFTIHPMDDVRHNPPTNYSAYRATPHTDARYICNQCLATVVGEDAKKTHAEWHRVQRSLVMSTVKWCDVGDHAFKASEKGAQSVTGTENDEFGNPMTVQHDACAKHAYRSGPRQTLAIEQTSGNCPECNEKSLVYVDKAGVNLCTDCGWTSAKSVRKES